MIVKCVRIINTVTGEIEDRNNWLTVGKQYVVLSIYVSKDRKIDLSCQSDDNMIPILMDSTQFVTVDESIPSNWVCRVDGLGNMDVGPKSWLIPGFWEKYFDSDPSALKDYDSETSLTIREARRQSG